MNAILPTVYLVRHGETEWSRDGRHTGTTDLPLTAAGEVMAHALKAWFADVSFALVMTSPMRRARETCELAGLAGHAGVSADLSEWDYGDYEGRSSDDIRTEIPTWNVFRDGCPGGETPAEVSQRADRLIDRLLAVEGNIALFSHGQFSCALAARWIGLAIVEGQHFALDVGSVSILGSKPAHPLLPVICQWNGGPSARPDRS
ncbi:MAG: histidine phosphatase family protein [Sphingomonadaceae bacterium]|nr:histidine phosphatase family protein [Sphingomonadaceae bacterium]